jgi:haloacetate dehalogenase
MFEGFEQRRVRANGIEMNVRTGGTGPALVLVHGFPQTHVMWHRVAPALAEQFTVILPDLRGYGDSEKPVGGGDHMAYAKRTMAQDVVDLARELGHHEFYLAGHDRGARVSYRLAFDHPNAVRKVALLDIIPTHASFSRMGWQAAMGTYHWLFLAQPEPLPERLIGGDPVFYLHSLLKSWAGKDFVFEPEAVAEYERCYSDPATIHATCEDYRAGASVDFAIDDADYGNRKIKPPLLALWGGARSANRPNTNVETWNEWAEDVRGFPMECGHFIAEERPAELVETLRDFFVE